MPRLSEDHVYPSSGAAVAGRPYDIHCPEMGNRGLNYWRYRCDKRKKDKTCSRSCELPVQKPKLNSPEDAKRNYAGSVRYWKKGFRPEVIAHKLDISPNCVRMHLRDARRKGDIKG